MTSERVQRVSQEVIDNIIDEDLSHLPSTPVGRCVHPVMTQKIALDLRDARVDLHRLTAESAELRAALATARRDAIEEAVQAMRRRCHEWTDEKENDRKMIGYVQAFVIDTGVITRALAPDTAKGESATEEPPHPDWCPCSQCHPPTPNDPPGPSRPPTTPRARVA